MMLVNQKEKSYELIDSGEGMKLERFGQHTLVRPDPEALWPKKLDKTVWEKADATYLRKGASGSWTKAKTFPAKWNISYGGLTFELRPTSFKHVGLFPEQKSHWEWMETKIKDQGTKNKNPIKVLNLFAYTGGATLSAAKAGAEVTHVDSSKVAIDWARKNAELSGLSEKPIRWIEDDVLKFLRREVKRGNHYDAIVMDPPAFGHGTGGSLWKIERDFYELFTLVEQVLSEDAFALIVNGYTAGYSPITLENNLKNILEIRGGVIEHGELALSEEKNNRAQAEQSSHDGNRAQAEQSSHDGRLLPAGVYARWSINS